MLADFCFVLLMVQLVSKSLLYFNYWLHNNYTIGTKQIVFQVEIIRSRGYSVEVYKVTTEDGYILELHRIPYGKGQSPDPSVKRQPVYLQHGFLNSDNVWIINSNDKALGKCHWFLTSLFVLYYAANLSLYLGWHWLIRRVARQYSRQYLFARACQFGHLGRRLLGFFVSKHQLGFV